MSVETLTIGLDAVPHPSERARSGLPARYSDCRPSFLNLSQNALKHSKDHEARPVIVLSEAELLPWCSGFAETINGGKSPFSNEDHGAFSHEKIDVFVTDPKTGEESIQFIELWYFGVFDGHAGCGASVFASKNLYKHVTGAIKNVGHLLVKEGETVHAEEGSGPLGPPCPPVHKDLLIRGALEQAFIDMDAQIQRERATYSIPGGCTAIAAIFMMGKLYVANAGDSRSIICREPPKLKCASCSRVSSPSPPAPATAVAAGHHGNSGAHAGADGSEQLALEVVEVSHDFTPETDRNRLQYLAMLQPKLLRGYFGRIEWQRRLRKKDIDKRVLCRDAHMLGWVFRTVTEEDVSLAPMLTGEGKRSRLLGTIGTSRGFGDHDLVGPGDIHIKPFLTPAPEVVVYDLTSHHHTPDDVLIMATDGLWERLNNNETKEVVEQYLAKQPTSTPTRYISLAQQLVLAARGNLTSKGWRTASDEQGSYDDISVFVIPLCNNPFNPPPPSPAPTTTTTSPTTAAAAAAVAAEANSQPSNSRDTPTVVAAETAGQASLSEADLVAKGNTTATTGDGAGPDLDERPTSLSPHQSLGATSPNPSLDSEMVVLDSLTAHTMPSVEAGAYQETGNGAAMDV